MGYHVKALNNLVLAARGTRMPARVVARRGQPATTQGKTLHVPGAHRVRFKHRSHGGNAPERCRVTSFMAQTASQLPATDE